MQHELKRCTPARAFAAALLFTAAAPAYAQLSLQQAMLLQSHGIRRVFGVDAPLPAPAITTEDALHTLADEAAIILRGEVLRITTEAAATRIDIRVDDGIRGVSTGEVFAMREWTGLWTANPGRYHVGQRALFLLHQASAGGYTSPVGGQDGVLPLTGDEVSSAVDLRWVAARVARTVATRPDNAPDGVTVSAHTVYPARGAVAASPAHSASAAANGIAWPADTVNGNVLGPDLRSIDSTLVTGLLRAWAPPTSGASR